MHVGKGHRIKEKEHVKNVCYVQDPLYTVFHHKHHNHKLHKDNEVRDIISIYRSETFA